MASGKFLARESPGIPIFRLLSRVRKRDAEAGRSGGAAPFACQYSLGNRMVLLQKYRLISCSGKSVNGIRFVKTMLPLPSSQVSTRGVVVRSTVSFQSWNSSAATRFFVALRQGDFVEKPISPASVGNIFRAVGEEHAAHKAVAIPLFAARELPQVGWR